MGASLETVPGLAINHIKPEQLSDVLQSSILTNLKKIRINGNFGDIVMHPDPKSLIESIIVTCPGVEITIHTNGGAQSTQFWEWLGQQSNIHVIFGIDGMSDTHHLYRRRTRWEVVIKNACAFIDQGKNSASWDMLVFRHNQHQVEECRQLAEKLGFQYFNAKPTTRWHVHPITVVDSGYNPAYELAAADSLSDFVKGIPKDNYTKQQYLDKFKSSRGIKPTQADRKVDNSLVCKVKKIDEIYIDAGMKLFPCCWMAYPAELDSAGYQAASSFIDEFIRSRNWNRDFNNLHHYTVEEILDTGFLEEIESAWQEKPVVEYAKACGAKSIMDIRMQHTQRWTNDN